MGIIADNPSKLIGQLKDTIDAPLQTLVSTRFWFDITSTLRMADLHHERGGLLSRDMEHRLKKARDLAIQKSPQAAATAASATGHALVPGVAIIPHVLTLGGIASAFGPWITAAMIANDYRGDINKNDLHDIVSRGPNNISSYPCDCPRVAGGRTQCDHAIGWLISRGENNLAVTAVSIFVAGVPKVGQVLYRGGRYVRKRYFTFKTAEGKTLPTPTKGTTWQPNSDRCFSCNLRLTSKLQYASEKNSARHHCRVCGQNFCSNCCSFKAAVLNALTPKGRRDGIEEHALICNVCLADAREQHLEISRYDVGPERYAAVLKKNATPRSAGNGGCKRAQAALFAVFQGDLGTMQFSLLARDGDSEITRRMKL